MKRNLILMLVAASAMLLSCNKPQPVDPIIPEPEIVVSCTTDEASAISETQATLNGSVVFENLPEGMDIKAYFYYSETIKEAGKLVEDGIRVSASAVTAEGGSFKKELNDLKDNTTYYFAAAVNIDGKDYAGEVKSFTTVEHIPELTVTTRVADVSSNKDYVFLSVEVTSEDPEFKQSDITEVAFYYSATATSAEALASSGTKAVADRTSTSEYTVMIPKTSLDGKYYFMPVVEAYGKTADGEIHSFTYNTPTPVLTSVETTDITFTSARVSGVINPSTILSSDAYIFMLLYTSASITPVDNIFGTIDYESGNFSFDLQDLDPATHYNSYITLARNGESYLLSESPISFDTPAPAIVVTTGSPDTSDGEYVRLSAQVTSDDIELKQSDITEVAFYYTSSATGISTVEDIASVGTKAVASYLSATDEYVVSIPKTSLDGVYIFVPCATAYGETTFGSVGGFVYKKPAPVLTSVTVYDIRTVSAKVSGAIDPSTIVSTDATIFIILTKQVGGSTDWGRNTSGTIDCQSGEFSFDLQDLDPASHYQYRLELHRDGKQYSLMESPNEFDTPANPALKVSLSLPPTLSATSTVSGKVTSNDPSFKYSDVGTCIVIVSPKAFTTPGNLDQSTAKSFPVTYNSSTGAYTATLTGLDTRVTYYVMTAVNAYSKLFYSDVQKFSRY